MRNFSKLQFVGECKSVRQMFRLIVDLVSSKGRLQLFRFTKQVHNGKHPPLALARYQLKDLEDLQVYQFAFFWTVGIQTRDLLRVLLKL